MFHFYRRFWLYSICTESRTHQHSKYCVALNEDLALRIFLKRDQKNRCFDTDFVLSELIIHQNGQGKL